MVQVPEVGRKRPVMSVEMNEMPTPALMAGLPADTRKLNPAALTNSGLAAKTLLEATVPEPRLT